MDFHLAVAALEVAQGKGAEGTLRLEPGLQAGPEEGRENHIEMKMQFGLRTGLTVVKAQVLLGVAEGKLDLEAGAVAMEDAFRRQVRVGAVEVPSVVRGSAPRGRAYTTCNQPCQALLCSAAWYRSPFSGFRVVRAMRAGSRRSKLTVELPRAAGPPRMGAGVAKAQDRVLALPPHHVQAQGPHPLHEGPGGVVAVGRHPTCLENVPGSGGERLPQQGQAHVDGRLPARGRPAGLPARRRGARRLPGT